MVRIGSRYISCIVTAIARIRCIIVIPVMTGRTIIGNTRMRSIEGVIIIVNGECGGLPTRTGGMTSGAIGRNTQRYVVGIQALVVIGGVTSGAIGGGTLISIGMTFNTIGRHVRSGEREC